MSYRRGTFYDQTMAFTSAHKFLPVDAPVYVQHKTSVVEPVVDSMLLYDNKYHKHKNIFQTKCKTCPKL
jgi:hypothetical protein